MAAPEITGANIEHCLRIDRKAIVRVADEPDKGKWLIV